jgi:acyl-coenzyme A synthetase/AMP-(fatty) acid ligase
MSKLFLADQRAQKSCTYQELIEDLNSGPHELSRFFLPQNTYDAFRAYLLVLLCELDITLLDTDFSKEEVEVLVPNADERACKLSCRVGPPIRDEADLLTRIRLGGSGRIGFFTSGTTGLPRRVSHQMSTLSRSVKYSAKHSESVWAFAYNPTHIAGCQVFMQAVLNGNSLVNVFGLDRSGIYHELEKYCVSHISATPTFYRMLMPAEQSIASVKRVTFGGERMDPNLVEYLKKAFPAARFLNVYASTEAGTILAAEGEVFSIKEGLEDLVRIDNDELMVHQSLLGKFGGSPKAQADDWYGTGDVVAIVSTSPLRFKILHRSNELINVGGYKVNPAEVEAVLRSIGGVAEVRVFAKKNSVLGHLVCCDLVLSDSSLTENAVRQYLNANLQSFKIPRIINFVEEIEITRTGKLKRS